MSQEAFSRIEALLDQLNRDEQLQLIERLAGRLRKAEEPASGVEAVMGALRLQAPEMDMERALMEIRPEWLTALEQRQDEPKGE